MLTGLGWDGFLNYEIYRALNILVQPFQNLAQSKPILTSPLLNMVPVQKHLIVLFGLTPPIRNGV